MLPQTFEHDGNLEDFIALVEFRKGKGIIKVTAVGTGVDDTYSSMSRAIVMAEYRGVEQSLATSGLDPEGLSFSSTSSKGNTDDLQKVINDMVEKQKTTVKIKQWNKDD